MHELKTYFTTGSAVEVAITFSSLSFSVHRNADHSQDSPDAKEKSCTERNTYPRPKDSAESIGFDREGFLKRYHDKGTAANGNNKRGEEKNPTDQVKPA